MRVLSLLPVVGHVRDSKRIDMLKAQGATVEVGAFNRPHHVGRAPRAPVTVLANISHGRYLRRMLVTLTCISTVIRLARRNDVIYASGQDMGMIGLAASLFTGTPVVLEVGDIREIQLDYGWKGAAMRVLERFMTRRLKLVVVTAEGFVTGYYHRWLRQTPPYLTIENKLEESFVEAIEAAALPERPNPRDGEPVVIGYFGLLRYQWSIDALAEAVRHGQGRIRVLLAGSASEEVDITPLTDLPGVEYLGEYKSPGDLPGMYGRVDVIWCCNPISCQDSRGKNWAWARTNRFYESCLFRKPLIVLDGIGDAEVVEAHGVGLLLKDLEMTSVRDCVDALTPAGLAAWREAFRTLPRSVYSYTDEPEVLARRLRRIAGVEAS